MKINSIAPAIIFILIVSAIPLAISTSSTLNDGRSLVPSLALGGSYQIEVQKEDILVKDFSTSVPYYRVVDESRDEKIQPAFMKPQNNIPSEEEAKAIANSYLQSHGGIPEDAVITNVEQQYLEKIDYTTGEVVERYPLATEVSYGREINGMEVAGPGDFIMVSVGEDGKVLCYLGSWRTLKEIGSTEVISPDAALVKLENGQVIQMPLSPLRGPLTVNEMHLGYYSQASGEYQEFYQPIWIFKTVDSNGENIDFAVKATAQ